MSCEMCPASGGGCIVCQDTPAPDPLTPAFLYDYGCGSGIAGDTLAHALSVLMGERGVLSQTQMEDLIQGWEAGGIDADNFRRDMDAMPQTPPEDLPF